MARPMKEGLLYFPFDIDFFQDKKIKILKGRYGADGILVYMYLLCEIYKNGYYIDFDEDLILCISEDLNITEASTRQIISFLLSRSLLAEISGGILAKSDTVLTAASIQRRYQEAMKGLKRDVIVRAEYWLLEPENTLSFIKVHPKKPISEKNDVKSENNSDKSQKNDTKKRRQKEIKEKEMSSSDGTPLLTAKQRSELIRLSSVSSVNTYEKKLYDWLSENGKRCKDPFGTIKKWIAQDKAKKKGNTETSYDLDDYEQFAMNYDFSNAPWNKGGDDK